MNHQAANNRRGTHSGCQFGVRRSRVLGCLGGIDPRWLRRGIPGWGLSVIGHPDVIVLTEGAHRIRRILTLRARETENSTRSRILNQLFLGFPPELESRDGWIGSLP